MSKSIYLFSFLFAIALIVACNNGSEKDPSTNDLGEFNPAGQLQSLTRSEKLVLTWIGGNAEDDFQGYHVFGTTKTLAQLQELALYPKDVDITHGQSIPRCKDNSDFFVAFGFPESKAECESSSIEENTVDTGDNPGVLVGQSPGRIIDDLNASEDEASASIDFNLACTGDDQGDEDNSVSLPAVDGKALGRQFCDVEQAWDANSEEMVDLANGTSYSFMVLAVKGSDKNEVSWISNVINDTPIDTLFSDVITISKQEYSLISIDSLNFTESTHTTGNSCPSSSSPCKLSSSSGLNTVSSEGVFIGRDNQNPSYRQRIFVSTSNTNGGKLLLQARGPETWVDPRSPDEVLYQKPGDQAQATFAAAGTTFAIFGNQVFDLKATDANGDAHYGKVVITNLSFEGDTESNASLNVTISLQKQIDSVDYFVAQ